jgi:hypothetical protein
MPVRAMKTDGMREAFWPCPLSVNTLIAVRQTVFLDLFASLRKESTSQ